MRALNHLLLSLISIALVGCVGFEGKGALQWKAANPAQTSLITGLSAELSGKCMGCHKGDLFASPTSLMSAIVAGEPDKSPLYNSIVSGRMPKNAARLSDAEIESVRNYILLLGDRPVAVPTEPTVVDYAALKAKVLGPKCIMCHGERMDTEPAFIKNYLVPGDPAKSRALDSMEKGRMPKLIADVTAGELGFLEQYIHDRANPTPTITHQELLDNFLKTKCTSCHKGMRQEEGFARYFVAGDPAASKVHRAIVNGSMPKHIAPATTEEIEMMRSYISNLKPAAAQ